MKKVKRILCAVLILCLLASLSTVFAATGTLGKNTGKRHQVCATLSKQAKNYYTGQNTWDGFSMLAGVSAPTDSYAAMQGNPMYDAIRKLMTDTHTNRNVVYSGTGNNALATYWKSTDSAAGSKSYLFFYGDIDSDNSGYTMNREHIWCKANASFKEKGGGADLHHLRPSISSVNAAKGSLAFGNVRGKYSDARTVTVNGTAVAWASSSKNLFEVKDDIKGDVARILLYVYCRWGQPNLYSDVPAAKLPAMDSDDELNYGEKVVESLDVLLQWMRIDPVDEWEMERNDQCENVQGNRNVFIDYPELAFLMFGKAVPTDMATPSGRAMFETHNWDSGKQLVVPSCTEPGLFVYSCFDCNRTRSIVIPATGHHYVNNVCTSCGAVRTQLGFVRTNELHDGDEVIFYYPGSGMSLSCTLYNSNFRCGESIRPDADMIYTDNESIVWTVEEVSGGFHLKGADGKLLKASTGSNYLNDSCNDSVWTVPAAKTANCVYLKNTDGKCVEWYANYKDFCSYTYSSSYESAMAAQVFTKEKGDPCEGYTDIDRNGWYHTYADFVIEKGLMGSTTSGLTFEPNTPCTRSMIVTILYSLANKPAVKYEDKFPDVKDGQWYTAPVMWAYQNGIVSGYNTGYFGTNDKVTREQLAVIFKAYAEGIKEQDTSDRAALSGFADKNKVTWSKDAVAWAVAAGLISGKPGANGTTLLDPQGKASRAEVAVILMKFLSK